ncbi:uncharacterized protein LOC120335677 [Styela clava]
METLSKIMKCAIWIAIAAVTFAHVENFLQSALVDVGVLPKRYTAQDLCDVREWHPIFIDMMGCETKVEKQVKRDTPGRKPKIKLSGNFKNMLKKKTMLDHLYDVINDGFLWIQSWIVPKKYRLPCLFGDCNMNKQIKRQKDILLYKDKKKKPSKDPLVPTT